MPQATKRNPFRLRIIQAMRRRSMARISSCPVCHGNDSQGCCALFAHIADTTGISRDQRSVKRRVTRILEGRETLMTALFPVRSA